MKGTIVAVALVVGCHASVVQAQVFLPATPTAKQHLAPAPPPPPPQEPTAIETTSPPQPQTQDQTVDYPQSLTEAGLTSGSTGTQLSLQTLLLYFTPSVRFYVRSTLPTTSTQNAPSQSTASSGTSAATSGEPTEATAAALLDPAGGLLNAQVGYYRKIANVPAASDANRGLFLDARVGAKLLETVDSSASSTLNGSPFPVTVFGSGVVSLKGIFNLLDSGTKDASTVGGALFAINYFVNTAMDPNFGTLLASDIRRTIHGGSFTFAFTINEIGYIAVDATIATNESRLRRRVAVSFNVAKLTPKGSRS